jgi:DNA-directed RNA polymerase subunit M/transcription elongation factor TFIIS
MGRENMADIDLQCPECKALMSVSEFTASRTVACKSCKHQIEVPLQHRDPEPDRKLRVKKRDRLATETDSDDDTFLGQIKPPKRRKPKSEWHVSQVIIAWAVFLALGTAMYFLRYRGLLEYNQLQMLITFSPLVIAAFQILIVLKAFQDSVLQGILCLLIPGYSFVYLFFMSDDFYARAVLGGLLVGMAKDSYLFYEQYALTVYNAINAWLASGG